MRYFLPAFFILLGLGFFLKGTLKVKQLYEFKPMEGKLAEVKIRKYTVHGRVVKTYLKISLKGINSNFIMKESDPGYDNLKASLKKDSHVKIWINTKEWFKEGPLVQQAEVNNEMIVNYTDLYALKMRNKYIYFSMASLLVFGSLFLIKIAKWSDKSLSG